MIDDPTTTAVFLAGVVTILTPCCLPMIPVLVVGGTGHRLRPVAVVAGSTLTFTVLGVLTGVAGSVTPDSVRVPFAVFMLAFGGVMADDDLNRIYSRYASRFASRATTMTQIVDEKRYPLANAFVVGLLLGAIWLPCVGPILGGVLAYAGTTANVTHSAWLLFVYGAGFSVPLLGVAYGGRRILDAVTGDGIGRSFRTATGYAFVTLGVALLFGLDKLLLATLIDLL
ncbi:cytochrome c biogenesis CcdA family protein [Halorussus salinisoli]|uniref:cytochrome c biogenesis CcdA family protein n=1 Tax=Halorussus salinisoli TaxID=2558242 RepID=UPI0010C205DF|nr:cytochrome c biogenesis CcdA family protein [Halorussus salinisoli]